ncbi:MAG: PA0069 family radical SAM protein [Acidobacteriota bacterium]
MEDRPRARGTYWNPPNRFEPLAVDWDEGEAPSAETVYLVDSSRSALAENDSPDIPFRFSVNPYRGCEHGCIYCYARPTHEYLGFSAGLDFETKILVKRQLPELLRRELGSPRWRPQPVALSGVTDPYQPVEKKLGITRRVLAVLADFRNPVVIATKNFLVTRDIDLLQELAQYEAVHVRISITSLDPALQRIMEPRTASPARRLEAIRRLSEAQIPVGVLVAPVIPGLTDHEIPAILREARSHGALAARCQLVRLPLAVANLFTRWLQEHFPDRAARVLARIRETHGGRLNDPRFHVRMRGVGSYARQVEQLFEVARRRNALAVDLPPLSSAAFRRPAQQTLPFQD